MRNRTRHVAILAACAVFLVGALTGLLEASASASASRVPGGERLRVGSLMLTRCGRSPLRYCGRMSVPLDWSRAADSPDIAIAVQYWPASDHRRSSGTVVPVEGGPGGSTLDSLIGGYQTMYGRLLRRDSLLAIDLRGTGTSTAIDCPAVQDWDGSTDTRAFQRAVGDCGRALDHRWRYRSGGWVHASDLFSSVDAAHDLHAVLTEMRIGQINLYGDSYGSYFAQVFAAHYPNAIRSLTLDSTYQVKGLDPWYRSTMIAIRAAFRRVCASSAVCRAANPDGGWAPIARLGRQLRRRALTGVAPGISGQRVRVTMTATGLVDLLNDAGDDTDIYEQLDAAADALAEDGDATPLLRLYEQRLAADENYFGGPAATYSVGLYFAVACTDYRQLFNMASSVAARRAQLLAAERALPRGTFAPFSTAEWIGQNENTEAYTGCLDWPAPTGSVSASEELPRRVDARTPVLILSGQLDSWTPHSGVATSQREIGGRSRIVTLVNSTHVVGEGDTACGDSLVQAFVAHPGDLSDLNASCATRIADLSVVGAYPSRLSDVTPLAPASPGGPGDVADLAVRAEPARSAELATSALDLRLGAAGLQTADDAITRFANILEPQDIGLHGGSISYSDDGTVLRLNRDQLIPGVAVTGSVRVLDSGRVAVAALVIREGAHVVLERARWTLSGSDPVAHGTLRDGLAVIPVSGAVD